MGATPDTVNKVESLVGNLRREFIQNLDLPPHVIINLHERDQVFEEHLSELLAFAHLKATKNELAATEGLSGAIDRQVRIGEDQAIIGRSLVRLTWALVIVGAGTLAAGIGTALYLFIRG